MANFDSIFPTPPIGGKLTDIQNMVNTNNTDKQFGNNPNASVTILEFSDFQCPACAQTSFEVHKVIQYYGNQINFIYKHFPAHDDSLKAAEASECARDQGKFWEYHDKLFENMQNLKVKDLKRYAQKMLLDTTKFNECLDSGIKSTKIESDFAEGIKYQIRGTPTFIINEKMVTGGRSFEEFKQIIGAELKNAE